MVTDIVRGDNLKYSIFAKIREINLFRIKLPLKEPYHLSYGSIAFFDSLLADIILDDGSEGWGESTPLPGYSDSEITSVWSMARNISTQWIGRQRDEVLSKPLRGQDGFLFTALWTALEMASGIFTPVDGSVPLVGIVQERPKESPKEAIERVRNQHYKTFKIKVGFEPIEKSKERIIGFQDALRNDERIRIDANQALSITDALIIASICVPGKIELLEQPLPIDSWQDCSKLAIESPVPIMLDESITDRNSIKKTAELKAAEFIKLKWMKQGGWFYLREMIETAERFGLKVILGNGVAGYLNNLHEAIFWLTFLQGSNLAGEMNGFLKLLNKTSDSRLQFRDGSLQIIAQHEMKSRPREDCIAEREIYTA